MKNVLHFNNEAKKERSVKDNSSDYIKKKWKVTIITLRGDGEWMTNKNSTRERENKSSQTNPIRVRHYAKTNWIKIKFEKPQDSLRT